MKVMCLNGWGGKEHAALSDYLADEQPDVLCLQEVVHTPNAPKDWLTPRIERRFEIMLTTGALEEAQAMRATWDPIHPSSKAIGAAELIGYLDGSITLEEAKTAAVIATRQYAKRQRTWFRRRMRDWLWLAASDL